MSRFSRYAAVVLFACPLLVSPAANARTKKSELREIAESLTQPGSVNVPATGEVEFAFSPNEGSEALVLKVIESARTELRMLAYSFTSAPVTRALLDAKKRGVDVKVVVDYKNNEREDRSGKAKAALGALATAGIPVRTISVYPIHHDKTIIVDRMHVETGSFTLLVRGSEVQQRECAGAMEQPSLGERIPVALGAKLAPRCGLATDLLARLSAAVGR